MAGQMSHMKLRTPHFFQLACRKRGVKERQSSRSFGGWGLVLILRFVLVDVETVGAGGDGDDGEGDRGSACTMAIGSPFGRFSHRLRTGSGTRYQGALRERRAVEKVSLSPQPGPPCVIRV